MIRNSDHIMFNEQNIDNISEDISEVLCTIGKCFKIHPTHNIWQTVEQLECMIRCLSSM